MKSYLFCFILEYAVVRSKMEVVTMRKYVQVDALTVVDLWSRAECYYRLGFHRWLLIY